MYPNYLHNTLAAAYVNSSSQTGLVVPSKFILNYPFQGPGSNTGDLLAHSNLIHSLEPQSLTPKSLWEHYVKVDSSPVHVTSSNQKPLTLPQSYEISKVYIEVEPSYLHAIKAAASVKLSSQTALHSLSL